MTAAVTEPIDPFTLLILSPPLLVLGSILLVIAFSLLIALLSRIAERRSIRTKAESLCSLRAVTGTVIQSAPEQGQMTVQLEDTENGISTVQIREAAPLPQPGETVTLYISADRKVMTDTDRTRILSDCERRTDEVSSGIRKLRTAVIVLAALGILAFVSVVILWNLPRRMINF